MAATFCIPIIFCIPSVGGVIDGGGGGGGYKYQTQLERIKLPLFGMIGLSQASQLSLSEQLLI